MRFANVKDKKNNKCRFIYNILQFLYLFLNMNRFTWLSEREQIIVRVYLPVISVVILVRKTNNYAWSATGRKVIKECNNFHNVEFLNNEQRYEQFITSNKTCFALKTLFTTLLYISYPHFFNLIFGYLID